MYPTNTTSPEQNSHRGESIISWLTISMLVLLAGLIILLTIRIDALRISLLDFSTHLDEHLSAIEAATSTSIVSLEEFSGSINVSNSPVIGSLENSEIVIVEFSDFECPYCAQGRIKVSEVLEKFPEDIVFYHKDYPLPNHKNAEGAAIAARCADKDNKYWEMYDLLFMNQEKLSEETIMALANQININVDMFTSCLKDPYFAEIVKTDQNEGIALKVDGTPTYFIGRQMEIKDGNVTIEGYVVSLNDIDQAVNKLINN